MSDTTGTVAHTDTATARTRYTLVRGSHGRHEDGTVKIYKTGDKIMLGEDEAKALGTRVEKSAGEDMPGQYEPEVEKVTVDDGVIDGEGTDAKGKQMPGQYDPQSVVVEETSDGVTSDTTTTTNMNHADILDQHWTHVKKSLADIDSADDLQAMRDLETGETGKNRQSVIEALDARIAELG